LIFCAAALILATLAFAFFRQRAVAAVSASTVVGVLGG
jgi:hypothetical protein